MNVKIAISYLIFIISNLSDTISALLYQKICYLNYIPYTINPRIYDVHELSIEWDFGPIKSLVKNPYDSNPESWKSCQFRDGTTDINLDNFDSFNNDNLLYQNYINFLIKYDGFLPNYYYVAWDINTSCIGPGSINRKVTFNIKYFSCEESAVFFYNSLNSILNSRVLASSTSIINEDVVIGIAELKYSLYLKGGNTNTVPICQDALIIPPIV